MLRYIILVFSYIAYGKGKAHEGWNGQQTRLPPLALNFEPPNSYDQRLVSHEEIPLGSSQSNFSISFPHFLLIQKQPSVKSPITISPCPSSSSFHFQILPISLVGHYTHESKTRKLSLVTQLRFSQICLPILFWLFLSLIGNPVLVFVIFPVGPTPKSWQITLFLYLSCATVNKWRTATYIGSKGVL